MRLQEYRGGQKLRVWRTTPSVYTYDVQIRITARISLRISTQRAPVTHLHWHAPINNWEWFKGNNAAGTTQTHSVSETVLWEGRRLQGVLHGFLVQREENYCTLVLIPPLMDIDGAVTKGTLSRGSVICDPAAEHVWSQQTVHCTAVNTPASARRMNA